MRDFAIHGIESTLVEGWQAGGADAHGNTPVRRRADRGGLPCRHCLGSIEAGEDFLVLSHRPFESTHPYAELGPILVHANPCPAFGPSNDVPAFFRAWSPLFLRAYGPDDWIRYECVRMTDGAKIDAEAAALLEDPDVARLHARSIWGCFLFGIARA